MAIYRKGKSGKVVIAGQTLSVTNWEATHEVELLDTTSTTSNGKVQKEGGLESLSFKIDAQWSTVLNAYDATVNAPPGTECAVRLYVDTSDEIFNISAGIIGKCDIKAAVNGVIEYTIEGHANTWTVVGSSAS